MGVLSTFPAAILNAVVPLLLVLGALRAPSVTLDIGILALVLLAAHLLALSWRGRSNLFLERTIAYVTVMIVAFLAQDPQGACIYCLPALFAVVAGLTAVWVGNSGAVFKVSTLDVLIVIVAITLPSVSGMEMQELGVVALEAIILFYAIEVLFAVRKRRWDGLSLGIFGALIVTAVKAF
jgi:UDP-GlcNAc:undecaprenyl-phosphate GlcNAc-1-phosphate transferase